MKSPFVIALLALFLSQGTATAGEFPPGTYTASIQKDWSLKFDDKGKFTVIKGGKAVVEGTYESTKTELTVTDVKGPLASKEADKKTGKFKWELKDGKLTFKSLTDIVTGRELVLTSNTWSKKK